MKALATLIMIIAFLVVAGSNVALAQPQASVEGEAYATELVSVDLTGLSESIEYRVEVVDSQGELANFTLVAYSGPIQVAEAGSGYIVFTAQGETATLYLKAGSPGTYTLLLLESGREVARYTLIVEPYDSKGGAEPDVAVDSGDEMIVAIASTLGMEKVGDVIVYEMVGAGSDGRATIYVVDNVILDTNAYMIGDFAALNTAGTREVLIAGAYKGVFSAETKLYLNGAKLTFFLIPGVEASGVKLEYLDIEVSSGGSIEYTPVPGQVPVYLAIVKSGFTGEITYNLPPFNPSQDLSTQPYLQFKRAWGQATVYLKPGAEGSTEVLAALSLVESGGLQLKLVNEAPEIIAGVFLTEEYSIVGSLEARGTVLILGSSRGALEAECIRFTVTSGTPDRQLPLALLGNALYLAISSGGGQQVTEEDLFLVRADCFRVEADRLSTTPKEIMDAYGTFAMIGVRLEAREAVIGYAKVVVTDEGPKPESSRPAIVYIIDSIVEARYLEIGGVYSTLLQPIGGFTYLEADTIVFRGAGIVVSGYEVKAGTILFHPIVFETSVGVNINESRLTAESITYICGTSRAEIVVEKSIVTAESLTFRGYASASFRGSTLNVAKVLGGGATPVGGEETVIDFDGATLVGVVEVEPLDYGVSLKGKVYLAEGALVRFKGATLNEIIFKAEGIRAEVDIAESQGTFRAELRDATLMLTATSPEAQGYVKSYGSSTLLLGCCMQLKGITIQVVDGRLDARLLGSIDLGAFLVVVLEERGNGKMYLRGGLSGETTTITVPIFKVTTEMVKRNPEAIMDAASEFVMESVYIKSGVTIIGYSNVTVTDNGVNIESSRPAVVKVYRSKIESEGLVVIGGVEVTHVKATTVKGGLVVLRGAMGEYQASITARDEVIVNPLVFGVPVKHVFKASSIEARTIKYICGPATAEVDFYDSTLKAEGMVTAGRVTLKLSGTTLEVPVLRLGGPTPAGGDVNMLILDKSVIASGEFKVYSVDYPAVVVMNESVEVKSGLVEFKAGNAPLTLGGEGIASFKAYGVEGALELKALGADGSLRVYLEPGIASTTLYLEGGGRYEIVVPDSTQHEVTVAGLSHAALKVYVGADARVKVAFREDEYSGYFEVAQSPGSTVEVYAEGALLKLEGFKAVTSVTDTTPAEVMEASGTLRIVGGSFVVNGDFVAGYGSVKITEAGPRIESARPYKVEVEGVSIEASGAVMVGGVMETIIVDSTLSAPSVVVRGADVVVRTSTLKADTVLFHPLVFGVPVYISVEDSQLMTETLRYLCGAAQALVVMEGVKLGSMDAPSKLYLVGIVNMLFKKGEAYLSEVAAGILTPINTGKYAHIAFIHSLVEGENIAFKYGEKGAAIAVIGGTFKAGEVSLEAAKDEVERKGVLTIAGASVDVKSCGEVMGGVYAVNVNGAFNCPGAGMVSFPEGVAVVGEVYGVLEPGVKLGVGDFLVKLAGGFTGPVAVYAAFAVSGDGSPYMVIVPVNMAYQSQVYEVYYPLPECDKPFMLVDAATGAVMDAAKPENPENCLFKSHFRVKPEAHGNAEPLVATAKAAVVETQVVVVETQTVTETLTQTLTRTHTITQTVTETNMETTTITYTETTTATTTTTVTATQTNMGVTAAAAVVGLLVGAAAVYALRARG
ncbi:MAG: hypothetical protein F7B17_07620 [Desulfurococcales archaeon]|nr:hypothetical protein [Desulfurococcales archaeon]